MLALFTRLAALPLRSRRALRHAVVAARVGALDLACGVRVGGGTETLVVVTHDRATGAVELAWGGGGVTVEQDHGEMIFSTYAGVSGGGAVRVAANGAMAFRVEAGDLAVSGSVLPAGKGEKCAPAGVTVALLASGHLVVGGRETVLLPGAPAVVGWRAEQASGAEDGPAAGALAALMLVGVDREAAGRRLSAALDLALGATETLG